MSLSFLVPAFLAGLAALAIPILIHLSRRETREPTPFPSLMFLEKLPQKNTQKRRIHRWPLLLLRCLAIALLVLAFARPFVERGGAAVDLAPGGDREVVLLVDRSYSMALGDRWTRAIEAAIEVVDGLSGGDRGTVIFFDSGAEAATESTTDRNVLRAALREATSPGVRTTRYGPGLRYAGRILSSSPLPRHELVVISDFQLVGWDVDGGETTAVRLPAGTEVIPISVADSAFGVNVTVAGADFDRTIVANRERVTVAARLTGTEGMPDSLPVTLEIDGRVIETKYVDLGDGVSAEVRFDPLTLPESGTTRGVVRIPDDALEVDNRFHFVLSADQRIRVLIVEGSGAPRNASYFLQRALEIGDSPGFRPVVRHASELRAADLAGNPVVILNQAPFPEGEVGELLRQHVERGGGLVMLVGNNPLGSWDGVLPNLGAPVERSREGGVTLGYIDTGHPIFETFAGPRTGDFTSAHVYRYRPVPSGSFPRVLARLGDGAPALLERPVGAGRVLLWTSTLDGTWSDVTLQPIFLPFLHQLTKYAAGYTPPRSWLTVGDPFDATGALPPEATSGIALTPSSEQVRIDTGSPFEVTEVGFYELRDPRGVPLMSFAANVDPAEANPTQFDPEELRSALLAAASAEAQASAGAELTLEERERRQSGWWYLIVVALVLLAIETLFSNRREKGRWSWLPGGSGGRGAAREGGPGLAA